MTSTIYRTVRISVYLYGYFERILRLLFTNRQFTCLIGNIENSWMKIERLEYWRQLCLGIIEIEIENEREENILFGKVTVDID